MSDVPRLDGTTRLVHAIVAVLVLVMTATGTILYVGQLSSAIGRRALLGRIHVVSGVALLAVGLAVAVLRPATRGLRRELTDLGRWTRRDRRWLRRATRDVPAGKYNGGQKLATAAFGSLLLVQLATGAVMRWHDPFPDAWRTGATFLHDWGYLALGAVIVGHVAKAMGDPVLLRAVRRGSVPRWWAESERPGWLAAVDADAERAGQ